MAAIITHKSIPGEGQLGMRTALVDRERIVTARIGEKSIITARSRNIKSCGGRNSFSSVSVTGIFNLQLHTVLNERKLI
ncbi:hypothetical protein SDC9_148234 [bioreactor metagenome]|uniref:Uncharacterized protein n=1 Tax=bioreactor metagenome TaxID=1076179 RepID=A0A645EJY7_9ZZZZ